MKPVVLALCLAALAACQCLTPQAPARAGGSVGHLIDADGIGYCTAFYIGDDEWVTAGHCVLLDTPAFVDDRLVTGWVSSDDVDLAVLQVPGTGDSVRPLRVAVTLPAFGDAVHYIGWPYFDGAYHPGVYDGRWGQEFVGGRREFSAFVDGGASGSPLLDVHEQVVGVVVASWRGRPYSIAQQADVLLKFLHDLDK